jgi:hypothetical protein
MRVGRFWHLTASFSRKFGRFADSIVKFLMTLSDIMSEHLVPFRPRHWFQELLGSVAASSPRRRRRVRLGSHSFLQVAAQVELLESRELLSASYFAYPGASPSAASSPSGLTPAQVLHAYGVDQVSFSGGAIKGDGTGQTIAIIDYYDAPNIAADLAAFDAAFGIAAPPSFTKVAADGSTNYPPTDPAGRGGSWAVETSLDVEWAHALAPGANILLVEAGNGYSLASAAHRDRPAAGSGGSSFVGGRDRRSRASEFSIVDPRTSEQGRSYRTIIEETKEMEHDATSLINAQLHSREFQLPFSQNIPLHGIPIHFAPKMSTIRESHRTNPLFRCNRIGRTR